MGLGFTLMVNVINEALKKDKSEKNISDAMIYGEMFKGIYDDEI